MAKIFGAERVKSQTMFQRTMFQHIGILWFTGASLVLILTECTHTNTWRTCTEFLNASRTLYNLSVDQCVDECIKRPYCDVLRHRRARKECEIIESSTSNDTGQQGNDVTSHSACVEIQRSDIDAPLCNCTSGQICEGGECTFKECPKVAFANAKVFGNMRNIGSKVKVKCIYLVGKANVPRIATCNTTGNWSYITPCPENYPHAIVNVGSWFISVRKQDVTQNESRTICVGEGGNLVKIDTQEKQDSIAAHLKSISADLGYWIQGMRNSNGTLKFDDNTQVPPKNSTLWGEGQPDNADEKQDCIKMDSNLQYQWDDDYCSQKFYFICEFSIV